MSEQHRRVALRLSQLAQPDQRWFLSQLSPDDRVQICDFLDELKSFQFDEQTLAALMPVTSPDQTADASDTGELDFALIREVLANEPDWVIRALCSDARVKQSMGNIPAPPEHPALTGAARNALLSALERRVDSLRAHCPAAPRAIPAGGTSFWRASVRRLWQR